MEPGETVTDAQAVDQPIVIQFVNRIIADGIERDASAIRLGPNDSAVDGAVRIQYRIGEQWQEIDVIRRQFAPQIIRRLKMMAGLDYWCLDVFQMGTARITLGTPPTSRELHITFTKTNMGDEALVEFTGAGD